MVFSDLDFLLVFLPTTVFGFYVLKRFAAPRYNVAYLLIASTIFYSAWSVNYLALLAGSVLLNYMLSGVLVRTVEAKKLVLALGIASNLAILAFFKYFHFFTEVVSTITTYELVALRDFSATIVLPLGISFFTFQQIAYLVEVSREPATAEHARREPFLNYALFVMFFPHLIAGPIVRHGEVSRQIGNLGRFVIGERQQYGIMIFAVGLSKKVLIADPLSPIVAKCFSDPGALDALSAWAGLLAYTFQLYFDFSGYSDMAIGLAATFGIVFPMNFDRPYRSTSVQEFWRRWHITLSKFLRDYLYVPLGGKEGSVADICARIFITMLLGGLWHGAGWTFVLWGAYHGALLCMHRVWRQTQLQLYKPLAGLLTFVAVVLGWVLFRASNITDAHAYFLALTGQGAASTTLSIRELPGAFWLACALIPLWNERLPTTGRFALIGAIASGLLLFLALSSGGEISEFLYFQF